MHLAVATLLARFANSVALGGTCFGCKLPVFAHGAVNADGVVPRVADLLCELLVGAYGVSSTVVC